ncbi:MAG: MBL fold metallo-hydrolase, partial [Acidobacteria bacterium]|nr:MBL fold metallo-hydrolase [Acidobacteriota bacterium]
MQPIRVVFLGTGDAFSAGGRNQSAYIIQHPKVTLLLDCGATTLTSLNRHNIPIGPIDGILLSHLHGDHIAGLPFLFLHYTHIEPRARPLRILGPEGLEERIKQLYALMYPGDANIPSPFELDFTEVRPGQNHSLDILRVGPFPAKHQDHPPSYGYVLDLDGRKIVYTGDTGWTDELPARANGADLFICECSFYESSAASHLSYPTIRERLSGCGAKKIILTHLGREVLRKGRQPDLELAHDGLV